MKCIYCLVEKQKSYFKKREHVIPQCFGKFPVNNLVLHGTVCDDCNQYFGDKLELFLGRDSFEGFTRLKHGIKSKNQLNTRKRILSKIRKGEYKGAIIREKKLNDQGRIDIEIRPQVGIFNAIKQKYIYFEMGQIPNREYLIENGFQIKNEMLNIIGDDIEHNAIVKELNEKGIKINPDIAVLGEDISKSPIEVESDITVDEIIMRCLCKIAFNYLVTQVGVNFILSEQFDPIRSFVRYGKGNPNDFLLVNQSPILYEDQKIEKFNVKVTRGHLIMVEWIKEKLFSKLSLFNEYTYGINICSKYKGIWIPIRAGHHFDIDKKEVTRLFSIRKSLLL